MDREIRFRAWDEQNKIMHNNFQFIISNSDKNKEILIFQSDKKIFGPSANNINNFKIMQYTGMKDEKNKEIYENDILKFDDGSGPEYVEIGVCTWNFEDLNYIIDFIPRSCSDMCFYDTSNYKVIGNIFENPNWR
jgi:uncharacterized phage protein (TIGR01671 family)